MRIGARAHDFGKHSPKKLAEILSESGILAAQLAVPKAIEGIGSYFDVSDGLCHEIKSSFEEKNIEIPVLGCYIEPALPDKDERLAQLEIFARAMKVCSLVGAGVVGTETTNFSHDESEREKMYSLLLDSVLRMAEEAEKTGTAIGIEPVGRHTLNSPELTYRLLREVNSKRLFVIFDPVNLLSPKNIPRQEKLWGECFEAFGEKICALHLKDAVLEGESLRPCLLGEGVMKFEPVFSWLLQNKPDICVLREEISPKTAKKDIDFIKKLLGDKK